MCHCKTKSIIVTASDTKYYITLMVSNIVSKYTWVCFISYPKKLQLKDGKVRHDPKSKLDERRRDSCILPSRVDNETMSFLLLFFFSNWPLVSTVAKLKLTMSPMKILLFKPQLLKLFYSCATWISKEARNQGAVILLILNPLCELLANIYYFVIFQPFL